MELVDNRLVLVCFPRRVHVAEDGDRRVMLIESVQVAGDVRVAEVVVEDDDREVNVRVVVGEILVVLADARRVSEFVGIRSERMAVEKPDIVGLFGVGVGDCSAT